MSIGVYIGRFQPFHNGHAAILARAQEQSVKDQLKENTEEALKRGVFGAPTMFIGDAMFWGNDRLDHVGLVLAGRIKA